MKATQYLLNNLKWTFSPPDYSLIGTPTTKNQLFNNLHTFCQDVQPMQRLLPACDFACFSLNQVFLSKPTNNGTRHLKALYFHYANKLAAAQKVLAGAPALPAQDGQIVVETLAKNFVKGTQACKSPLLWADYCKDAQQLLHLSDQEMGYLNAFYEVYLCLYYATLYKLARKDDNLLQICNLTSNFDLVCHKWMPNNYYSRNFYKTSRLFAAVDCFCNSATIFNGNRTDVVLNLRFNFNKRNAFDTFTQHKYGKKSANFRARGGILDVVGHYHAYKNYEVRSYLVTNVGKGSGNLQCAVKVDVGGANTTHFTHNNACCFAKGNMYVALMYFVDGNEVKINPIVTAQPSGVKSKINLSFPMDVKQSRQIQLVTIYAADVATLTASTEQCRQIGFANAFAYSDAYTAGEVSSVATNLTLSSSNLYENQHTSPSKPFKFCYQMGDIGVATLVDDAGNNATLVGGFVSSGGEGVYAVANGKITKLNCGKAQIARDSLVYLSPSGELCLSHGTATKNYLVTTPKPTNILFLLPLEETSQVKPITGGFQVISPSRSFTLCHNVAVQCLTSNPLECNPSRLRCKLSGDLTCGNTLALYFAKATSLQLTLSNNAQIQAESPIVSGDICSTQLHDCNQRTIFALSNNLALPQPLVLAAIAYTHPRWLKNYLNCAINSNFEYAFYNAEGKKRYKRDLASTYFGALWLALLSSDSTLLAKLLPHTQQILDSNLALAYKALLVKKLSELNVDRVNNLVTYAQYKKLISKDKQALSLAQAVGAITLSYPSTQRLADLVKQNQLPKCWCHVAYYEILCNLRLTGGKVAIKPTPSAQGFVPSDFIVRVADSRVKLTFVPGKIPSATYRKIASDSSQSPQQAGICGQITVKY